MSTSVALRSQPAQCPSPVQHIPRSTAAKLEDKQGRIVALCALVPFTKSQAYLIVQQLDAAIAPKAVTVRAVDGERPLELQIDSVSDAHPNRSHMPMYIQVHFNPEERLPLEHLVDLLAETVLGRHNLELRKNLTIDLFDSAADSMLRDGAGFIVADRHRLQQITVNRKQALSVLGTSNDVIISPAGDRNELIDYDASLSNHQRADFVRFLFDEHKTLVAHWSEEKLAKERAREEQQTEQNGAEEKEGGKARGKEEQDQGEEQGANTVAGYLVASGERVLCVYAESDKVAEALLAKHIAALQKEETVSLCCSATNWTVLRQLGSLRTRSIYRRHTRMVPSNVKYDKVFALNVGMNFF